jgi:LysM repeat protein
LKEVSRNWFSFKKGRVVVRRFLLVFCVLALLLASFVPAFAQNYGQTIHVVERGETMAGIARLYGVSVEAIAQANGIWNPNYIHAGQRLVIPSNSGYPPPPPPQRNYYMVRWGDTLAGIARYFGVSPWSIAQANHIYNLNQIYAGMYLVIPSGGYPPPPPPPPHHPHFTSYYVQPGDTLASIAWRFGTTVEAIARANGIYNPNYIYWGMILNIPTGNW